MAHDPAGKPVFNYYKGDVMGYMILAANGEYMPVNEKGEIGRVDRRTGSLTVVPSPAWFIRGAVRYNNFGHPVEFRHFPECADIKDWTHKNGKPKWRIADHDHGTNRILGSAVKVFRNA